jgi:uncharacterized membrane protein HdeD (DUF308 family)
VTSTPRARTLEVRHLQLARAGLAALAAAMVTFSSDHSAALGSSVFSGFAITTGIVFIAAAWLVYPAGRRWPAVLLGATALVSGMLSGLTPLRTITGFFVIVIGWALISGAVELIAGWRELRRAKRPAPRARRQIAPGVVDRPVPMVGPGPTSESRDGLVVGVITLILGVTLMIVPTQYALRYTVEEAHQTFTLTGIIIGVGLFGGYAAVLAVYLGIAGFSPRRLPITTEAGAAATAEQKDSA